MHLLSVHCWACVLCAAQELWRGWDIMIELKQRYSRSDKSDVGVTTV